MTPRISMITLGVRDLARSVAFYGKGLGLPRRESPPEVAFFALDGTWLGLFGREDLAADAGVDPEGEGFAGFTLAHNLDSEAAVDALIAQAVAAGATRSEEHTSELQSRENLVCRLLLEKKKKRR